MLPHNRPARSGPAGGRASCLTLPSAAAILAGHAYYFGQHSHVQPDAVQACTDSAGGRRAMALVLAELKPVLAAAS